MTPPVTCWVVSTSIFPLAVLSWSPLPLSQHLSCLHRRGSPLLQVWEGMTSDGVRSVSLSHIELKADVDLELVHSQPTSLLTAVTFRSNTQGSRPAGMQRARDLSLQPLNYVRASALDAQPSAHRLLWSLPFSLAQWFFKRQCT